MFPSYSTLQTPPGCLSHSIHRPGEYHSSLGIHVYIRRFGSRFLCFGTFFYPLAGFPQKSSPRPVQFSARDSCPLPSFPSLGLYRTLRPQNIHYLPHDLLSSHAKLFPPPPGDHSTYYHFGCVPHSPALSAPGRSLGTQKRGCLDIYRVVHRVCLPAAPESDPDPADRPTLALDPFAAQLQDGSILRLTLSLPPFPQPHQTTRHTRGNSPVKF